MKQGWEIKPLGEICDSINGLWKGKKEPFVQVGVIRNTNFTKDCLLDISDIVYLDVEQKAFSKRSLTKGDIIIERSGGGPKQPVGRAVLFDIETGYFSFSNFTSILRLKNGIKISYYYLHKYLSYFYLSGKTECMQSNVIGIRNLDFDRYKNEVLVPFPSLLEQERIVGILDSAFAKIEALRANAQQNLQNAKDLFQASIENEFKIKSGWTNAQLNSVAEVISGYAFKSGDFVDKGMFQVIRIGNVKQNFLRLTESPIFIDSLDQSILCKSLLQQGDLVITQTGTKKKRDYGFVALVNRENLLLNQRVACVRFKDKEINPRYFLYYSYTEKYKNDFFAQEGGAVGQGNVGLTTIKELNVPFPTSKEEQQSIVKKLDALSERCRAMEENYRKTLTACNDLKRALLKKAFDGEL